MSKHSWNTLSDYLSVHEKTLRFYQKFMETPKIYTRTIVTDYEHWLDCIGIILQTYRGTRVRTDIRKVIEIDPSNTKRPRARTFDYTYSAIRRCHLRCRVHQSSPLRGFAPASFTFTTIIFIHFGKINTIESSANGYYLSRRH